MNTLNQFFFGIYPYICLSIFFLGSLVRFEREPAGDQAGQRHRRLSENRFPHQGSRVLLR